MVNKRFWLGMLAMALVFGMTVVGCDNGSTSDIDTWSDVTSLSQLNGTWKGSYTHTQTEEGITAKIVMEITMTINASTETGSVSMKVTMTFSGSNINIYWPFIKEGFDVSDGWTVNDATHTVTMTENMPSGPVSLSDLGDVKINQNGTKIKASFEDAGEIIMIKQ
jgi:hypothetical protein